MPEDASRYDRSRYAGRAREVGGGQTASARPRAYEVPYRRADEKTTAQEFSRDKAAERYREQARRASDGRVPDMGAHDAQDAAVRLAGKLKGMASRMRDKAAAHARRPAAGSFAGREGALRPGFLAAARRNPKRSIRNVFIVVFLALAAWYVYLTVAMWPSADVSGHVVAEGVGKPYYVLLLGSDSRDEEGEMARSDSIVLCRVDEGAKQVSLVSLPRDLRVEIAGHGTGKLNSALAYEGVPGAIDAVSALTGIQVSYYACIYFSGFEGIVDSLGGVDVEVPEGTYYDGVRVPAGDSVHIDGEQALVLARCRHGDPPDQGAYAAGDYQRTLNQRNLLKAMAKKILDGNPLAVPFFMTSLAGCVESNMPPAKMAWLSLALRGMDSSKMYSASAPATDASIGGVSYQILSEDAWASMKARLEAGQDPAG